MPEDRRVVTLTVNTGGLNHAQHVLCDVSMLLGKCAQRGSLSHAAATAAAEDDPSSLLHK